MALLGGGSWNGNVMSAFSVNRRRILSLWLPRLPIDRIKRQLAGGKGGAAKAVSSEVGPGSHSNQVYADCVDLSAVENASRQNSNNDPSIVVAKQNNALQIFALDDAAARLGLEVGLPLANARAICPQLRVFDADEVSDAKTLNDIAEWCDRFTPLVALDSPHGLFLDITGCAHLFSGEAAMMRLMCDVLTAQGFAVSAAIAGTSVCARTITRHVHGRIVRDGEEADAVKPLPVSTLGADEAITRGLRRAGLKTIADAPSPPRHQITPRFGPASTPFLEPPLRQAH